MNVTHINSVSFKGLAILNTPDKRVLVNFDPKDTEKLFEKCGWGDHSGKPNPPRFKHAKLAKLLQSKYKLNLKMPAGIFMGNPSNFAVVGNDENFISFIPENSQLVQALRKSLNFKPLAEASDRV